MAFPAPRTCGAVFKLTRSNRKWTESVVYAFQGASDGALPDNAVMFDKKGNLFGTTLAGGDYGFYGVAY